MAGKCIGLYKCPCCGSVKARASVSRAGLVCVTCNRCHLQMFARSELSDENIRAKLLPLPTLVTPTPDGVMVSEGTGEETNTPREGEGGTPAAPGPVEQQPAPAVTRKSAFDIY